VGSTEFLLFIEPFAGELCDVIFKLVVELLLSTKASFTCKWNGYSSSEVSGPFQSRLHYEAQA
jgi:hypothetical protein